jgi:hypothetical protein
MFQNFIISSSLCLSPVSRLLYILLPAAFCCLLSPVSRPCHDHDAAVATAQHSTLLAWHVAAQAQPLPGWLAGCLGVGCGAAAATAHRHASQPRAMCGQAAAEACCGRCGQAFPPSSYGDALLNSG